MDLGNKIINIKNVTYIDYEFKNGAGYSHKPFIRLYIHFNHDFIMFDFDDEKAFKTIWDELKEIYNEIH